MKKSIRNKRKRKSKKYKKTKKDKKNLAGYLSGEIVGDIEEIPDYSSLGYNIIVGIKPRNFEDYTITTEIMEILKDWYHRTLNKLITNNKLHQSHETLDKFRYDDIIPVNEYVFAIFFSTTIQNKKEVEEFANNYILPYFEYMNSRGIPIHIDTNTDTKLKLYLKSKRFTQKIPLQHIFQFTIESKRGSNILS